MRNQLEFKINLMRSGPLITRQNQKQHLEALQGVDHLNPSLNIEHLGAFLGIPFKKVTEEHVVRYSQVTINNPLISAPFVHGKLEERIYRPMDLARKSYVLKENISSIALAGLSAEMLAILAFHIRALKAYGNKPIPDVSVKKFETFGQEKRLSVLTPFLSKKTFCAFEKIRAIRRKHLHFWDLKGRCEDKDARESIQCGLEIMVDLTGCNWGSKEDGTAGTVVVHQEFYEFLQSHGESAQ